MHGRRGGCPRRSTHHQGRHMTAPVPERWVQMAADELGRGFVGLHKAGPVYCRMVADFALTPVLADLRAQVQALRFTKNGGYGNALDDVLALLDGGES